MIICPPVTICPIKKESILREDGFWHLPGGRILWESLLPASRSLRNYFQVTPGGAQGGVKNWCQFVRKSRLPGPGCFRAKHYLFLRKPVHGKAIQIDVLSLSWPVATTSIDMSFPFFGL